MVDLALHPLVTTRRPSRGDHLTVGYGLRLAGGFALDASDPLLTTLGIAVSLVETAGCEAAIGNEAFAPGSPVLVRAALDGATDAVSVWGVDETAMAGTVVGDAGAQLAAAVQLGLPLQARLLTERRDGATGERVGLQVLCYPSAQVRISVEPGELLLPPVRERRRLVLVASDGKHVHFWDPTGHRGPADPGDLELSPWLIQRVEALRHVEDEGLLQDGKAVWRHLRDELGAGCDVGYLGPGMRSPQWDDVDESFDDIPF